MDKETNDKHQNESTKDTEIIITTENNTQITSYTSMNRNNTKKHQMLNTLIDILIDCSNQAKEMSANFLGSIISKNIILYKSYCANGFPDELKIFRSLAWKINLGLISIDNENWDTTLDTKRKQYSAIKMIMMVKVFKEKEKYEQIKNDKVALSKFRNNCQLKVIEEIERDLDRTQMIFPSFFQPTDDSIKYTEEEIKATKEQRKKFNLYDTKDYYQTGQIETHADVIARLLFYYSNYYPDVYYIQGMNEIIAPIYYCYTSDKLYFSKTEIDIDIEADTFWSFFELMEQLRHVFIRDEDNNSNGVTAKANNLSKMLEIIDKELSLYLASIKVQFSFFSFRWFILLFAQDFTLDNVMKLWDLFFIQTNKYYFVYYFAIALIELKRDKLIDNALIDILTELQNFSDIDLNKAIELTLKLQSEYWEKLDPFIN